MASEQEKALRAMALNRAAQIQAGQYGLSPALRRRLVGDSVAAAGAALQAQQTAEARRALGGGSLADVYSGALADRNRAVRKEVIAETAARAGADATTLDAQLREQQRAQSFNELSALEQMRRDRARFITGLLFSVYQQERQNAHDFWMEYGGMMMGKPGGGGGGG